jgi:hypothetical protein
VSQRSPTKTTRTSPSTPNRWRWFIWKKKLLLSVIESIPAASLKIGHNIQGLSFIVTDSATAWSQQPSARSFLRDDGYLIRLKHERKFDDTHLTPQRFAKRGAAENNRAVSGQENSNGSEG